MQNFALKFQAVAEKTAKMLGGLLYFAAPAPVDLHFTTAGYGHL